jgi:hypothetical protein
MKRKSRKVSPLISLRKQSSKGIVSSGVTFCGTDKIWCLYISGTWDGKFGWKFWAVAKRLKISMAVGCERGENRL